MAGYGLVLVCPKCPPRDYFGMLKTPGNKAVPCPNCGTPLVAKRKRKDKGQSLVEFAVVLPLLMLLLLGFGETAFLVAAQHSYQNGVDVLAQWVAHEMGESPGDSWESGWNGVVRQEAERTGCNDTNPGISFPDGSHLAGDRILVRWNCHYAPRITSNIWSGGLNLTVISEAVVPGLPVIPSPSSS